MAIEKQINIVVKETGLDTVQKQVNKLDTSLENLSDTQQGLAKSMQGSSNSVLENGGAMGLLNDATGGLAMTVKDAVEATALFTKSEKAKAIVTAISTTVIGTSTGAMKAFRIALAATGVGLLVIGLGLLIANFDKVKNAVSNLFPGLKQVGDFITGLVENFTDFIGVTSESERALAELTAQADKSLAMNKKFVQEQGDVLNEYTKAKIDAKNRYLEAIKEEGADQTALANRLNRELVAIDDKHNDDLAKSRKEKQDKIDAENKEKEQKEKDRLQKIADQRKKEQEELNKTLEEQKNNEIALINELTEAIGDAQDKNAEAFMTAQEIEERAVNDKYFRLLELAKQQKQPTLDLEIAQANEINDIRLKADDAKREQDKVTKAEDKKLSDEKIALENSVKDAKIDIANQTLSLISEIAGKGSKVGKAIAITQATLSGVQGVQNAFTTASASPITALFPAYPFIQAVIAGAFSALQIAKLAKGEKAGGGSSGGGGGGATAPSAPSFNLVQGTGTNQIAQGLANQTQPLKAYVVGSDVTNQQQLDRNIVQGASLGG